MCILEDAVMFFGRVLIYIKIHLQYL